MANRKSRKPEPKPPANREGFLRRLVSNPQLGAAIAGGLFLATTIGLTALLGNPMAGTSQVRLPITNFPPGWHEALGQSTVGTTRLAEATYSLTTSPGQERSQVFQGPTSKTVRDPLTKAPVGDLTFQGPSGPLPIIAVDGRTVATVYARPFYTNGGPKVALIVRGLGLDPILTTQAIETLPPEITLAFAPYSDDLQDWIDLARANGHEVLIEVPMEPDDFPSNDPGPYTLRAKATTPDIVNKLEWILSRGTGYFGITNVLGEQFVQSQGAMDTLTDNLKKRGLAFIDNGIFGHRGGISLRATADQQIEGQSSPAKMDEQFLALEASALQKGQGLGIVGAYPLSLSQVRTWTDTVSSRGYQLAPASALITRR